MRRQSIFTAIWVLVLTLALSAAHVMTWVPSYFISKSKTALDTDFGGVGMKDGVTHLALQFWGPTNTSGAVDYVANGGVKGTKADVVWFQNWGTTHSAKVLLCVYNGANGWDWPTVSTIIASPTVRTVFVNNLVTIMDTLKLDGIEVDLEGPQVTNTADGQNFISFMTELSNKVKAKGKLLTVATFASQWHTPGTQHWSQLFPLTDLITSMGYEEIGINGSGSLSYAGQKTLAGTNYPRLALGMPTYLSTDGWLGSTTLQQVTWAADNGTSVAIWDASLGNGSGTANTFWRTAAVWNQLKRIKGVVTQTYPVTVTAQAGGTVTPGTTSVSSGSSFTFTVTPNTGYKIDSVKVGTGKVTLNGSNQYTILNITSSQTVNAYFSVTASVNANFPFPQQKNYGSKPTYAQSVLNSDIVTRWNDYKTKYLKQYNGKYYIDAAATDGATTTMTVSEAHGYGMILTAIMAGQETNAKTIFDGMLSFYETYKRSNSLMNWEIYTDGTSASGSATDGDMDIAYALLLAYKQWGDASYLTKAQAMISSIWTNEMYRTSNLLPSCGDSWWAGTSYGSSSYTRPSDWMAGHFRAFKEFNSANNWDKAADSVYAFYNKYCNGTTGLVPDFYQGYAAAPENAIESVYDNDYYYNACRVPLRFAMDYAAGNNSSAAAACQKIGGWITTKSSGNAANIYPGYSLSGSPIRTDYKDPVFTGPFGASLIAGGSTSLMTGIWDYLKTTANYPAGESYSASVGLLSMLVMSGNWWSPASQTSLPTYTVTSSVNNAAFGTITPSAVTTVTQGASHEFTVTANAGYKIDNVTVNGSAVTLTNGKYTITNIQANQTVTATLSAIPSYTVTASLNNGTFGTISPSGTTSVLQGGSHTFTVTANTGYRIDNVTVNGASVSLINGQYTIANIQAAQTVIATLSAVPTYTVTVSQPANGSITPAGSSTVSQGSSLTFKVTANAGYRIDSVKISGTSGSSKVTLTNGQYTITNILENKSVFAYLSAVPTYTVTAVSSANGTITPAGTVIVSEGSSHTFTVTANAGYIIDAVTVNGQPVALNASRQFTITNIMGDKSISASYSIPSYAITVSAGANGTISPSGSVAVTHGGSKLFTITPNSGYLVQDVLVNGVSVGAVTSFEFTNITGSGTISASFYQPSYSVVSDAVGNGTISPMGTSTALLGSSKSFTFTPEQYFSVDSVVVNGVNVGSVTSYTLSNISKSSTVIAYFGSGSCDAPAWVSGGSGYARSAVVSHNGHEWVSTKVKNKTEPGMGNWTDLGSCSNASWTVTPQVNNAAWGTSTPASAVTVPEGGAQNVTFTPAAGYQLDSITVNGAKVTPVSQGHTVTSIAAHTTVKGWFSAAKFIVSGTVTGSGTISPTLPQTVNYNESLTLTCSPSAGNKLDSVKVGGVKVTPTAGQFTIPSIQQNKFVEVWFSPITVSITGTVTGAGTVTPALPKTVNYGSSQILTFAAQSGNKLDSVKINGVKKSITGSTYTLNNITGDSAVSVWFSVQKFQITGTAGAGGTISTTLPASADYGSSFTVNFVPSTGKQIDSVKINNVAVAFASNAVTMSGITENKAVQVWFGDIKVNAFTITAASNNPAFGTISPSGTVSVSSGGSQLFTFTPAVGYSLSSVEVDGIVTATGTTYLMSNVTANRTITAYFASSSTTNPCTGVKLWNAADDWTTYTVGDLRVDSDKLWECTNVAYSWYQPSGANGAFGWKLKGECVGAVTQYTVSGTITGNGSISPALPKKVDANGSLTLDFTPASDSRLDWVKVNGSAVVVTGNQITLSPITADKNVEASFSVKEYAVSGTITGNGSVSPTLPQTVNHGANLTLQYTASAGNKLDSVKVNGTITPTTAGSLTLTSVTSAQSVQAYFSPITWVVSGTVTGTGTISPALPKTVNQGTSLPLTFTAGTGSTLDSVKVDGAKVILSGSSYTIPSITSSVFVEPYFSLQKVAVTGTIYGTGTVSPTLPQNVDYGSNLTLQFTPGANQKLDSVKVNGTKAVVTNGSCTIPSITSARTVLIYFSPITWKITGTITGTGTASPVFPVTVNNGANQTVTFVPGTNNVIDSVKVNGKTVTLASNAYTFTNVTGDSACAVWFGLKKYTVSAGTILGGTVTNGTSALPQIVSHGSNLTLTLTPESGKKLDSLKIGGTKVIVTGSTHTITGITGDKVVDAWFSPVWKITGTINGTGTVSPAFPVTVSSGANQTVTFTPGTNNVIDSVKVNGKTVTLTANGYTFSNVTGDSACAVWFGLKKYTVSAGTILGGTVTNGTSALPQIVSHGSNLTLTLTPESGKKLDSLKINGTKATVTGLTYTISSVTGDKTVDAWFSTPTFTVSGTITGPGTIEPALPKSVSQGSDLKLTFTPAAGSSIDSVKVSGAVVQLDAGTYTLKSIQKNETVAVYYAVYSEKRTTQHLTGRDTTISKDSMVLANSDTLVTTKTKIRTSDTSVVKIDSLKNSVVFKTIFDTLPLIKVDSVETVKQDTLKAATAILNSRAVGHAEVTLSANPVPVEASVLVIKLPFTVKQWSAAIFDVTGNSVFASKGSGESITWNLQNRQGARVSGSFLVTIELIAEDGSRKRWKGIVGVLQQ